LHSSMSFSESRMFLSSSTTRIIELIYYLTIYNLRFILTVE
jgi:hypothetical protein